MDISDVFENRRRNLAALIDRPPFSGTRAAFARHIGRSAPQVSQWLSGHRSITDESRDLIETACGLMEGWLDHQPANQTVTTYASRAMEPEKPLPPDLASAIPVVVRALAATPSMQFGKVISALESLDEHPEEADKVSTRVHSLLSSPVRRKQLANGRIYALPTERPFTPKRVIHPTPGDPPFGGCAVEAIDSSWGLFNSTHG